MKAPRTGTAQGWHQDSASWRDIFPMDLVTAWTAIDAATLDNGCLNFALGTHRWGMLRGERLAPFVADLAGGRWPIRPAPLRPGSISFHHSLTLHQSNANRTGTRRRGYAVHYMRAASCATKRSLTRLRCRPLSRCGDGLLPAGFNCPTRRISHRRPRTGHSPLTMEP